MKPSTYHEVSVSCLAKEVEDTKIVEEHRVEWNKFGCSIMMDKSTARTGKMIINVLVNSPKGSLFLESIDASDSSTNSIKMFSLFQNTIEKNGAENVVQVVTDNAAENVKAGDMLKGVFPHIYWTPCAAHCINLIFGDIFKERPFTGTSLVDGEQKPPMGYLYEEMDRAKEAIQKAFTDEYKYAKKNNLLNKEVWKGFHKCVAKLVVNEDVQDSITDEINTLRVLMDFLDYKWLLDKDKVTR
ncbi:hypothetical protein KY284_030452 [Solanum tuberosum]|nr:hypothetical protein KY284_030452 [Solanum tuberosum]